MSVSLASALPLDPTGWNASKISIAVQSRDSRVFYRSKRVATFARWFAGMVTGTSDTSDTEVLRNYLYSVRHLSTPPQTQAVRFASHSLQRSSSAFNEL